MTGMIEGFLGGLKNGKYFSGRLIFKSRDFFGYSKQSEDS